MGGKVCLSCIGETLLGGVNKFFWKQKVYWHHLAMFCLITSSKLSRQYFEFSLKVMGLNPGYLLKSFLLFMIFCFRYVFKIKTFEAVGIMLSPATIWRVNFVLISGPKSSMICPPWSKIIWWCFTSPQEVTSPTESLCTAMVFLRANSLRYVFLK